MFRPNDWYPVWAKEGVLCWYEILFSPKRNKYKLKKGGMYPKADPVYGIAVQKLNEFINGRQT